MRLPVTESSTIVTMPPPQPLGVPLPPHVIVPAHVPQLDTVRGAPHSSCTVSVPQFAARRMQMAVSDSGVHVASAASEPASLLLEPPPPPIAPPTPPTPPGPPSLSEVPPAPPFAEPPDADVPVEVA